MVESAFPSFPGEDDEFPEESTQHAGFFPSTDWHLLKRDEVYAAYAKDLDFMWRWVIVREDRIVQEGCSISLESSIRAVTHVLNYFGMTEKRAPETGRTTAVQH
ncbi:MAG: soluble methane monooxygenase-binding protein MmoD [Methylococcus sp.]|nr:soluble methane monooxygenase-binding protein MmoD [Methylococcus sp.]